MLYVGFTSRSVTLTTGIGTCLEAGPSSRNKAVVHDMPRLETKNNNSLGTAKNPVAVDHEVNKGSLLKFQHIDDHLSQ